MDEKEFETLSDRVWAAEEVLYNVKRMLMGKKTCPFSREQARDISRAMENLFMTSTWVYNDLIDYWPNTLVAKKTPTQEERV